MQMPEDKNDFIFEILGGGIAIKTPPGKDNRRFRGTLSFARYPHSPQFERDSASVYNDGRNDVPTRDHSRSGKLFARASCEQTTLARCLFAKDA